MLIYLIMNKDNVVAKFSVTSTAYGKTMQYVDTDVAKLPFKLTNLDKFIESRTVIIDRYDLKHKLAEVGINDKLDLISLTHGVSLADTFWVKEENSRYQWSDVSPYQSARQFDISWFFENMSNKQAYIGLPDYSTDGNFPKCWVNVENKKYLVKCGTSGAYNAGLEPLSEILFTQLADTLGFSNYVKYERTDVDYTKFSKEYKVSGLVRETIDIDENKRFSSMCECFTDENKGLVTAKELGLTNIESVIRFAREHCESWKDICNIYLCDALGMNEDRHNGNIGFYFNTDTYEVLDVAPMYDNNLSLLCYYDDRIDLQDYISQLRAKSGDAFEVLGKKMLAYLPEKRDAVEQISKSFEFREPFLVKNDRVQLLSDVVRGNAKRILK